MTSHVGVDVSKAKLDVALLSEDGNKCRSKVFANSTAGAMALVQWLEAHAPGGARQTHVCMEATGSYHELLALHLHDKQLLVSVANPMRVKRFIELDGGRNKTDSADARSLARFCRMTHPPAWEAPSKAVRSLQALVARLDTLMQMRLAECNRLDVAHEDIQPSVKAVIQALDKSIQEVKSRIRQTIDDDPDLKRRDALLQSIPGLGDRTVAQLLAYIGRPERFKSAKALAAFASLSPVIKQSGSSLNKRVGTHGQGHRALKCALYFPAMAAARFNPLIRQFSERLKAQNKPGKVVLVACMHKLLAIAFGVLKSGEPFNPEHGQPRAETA